jgi:hypothetical protein
VQLDRCTIKGERTASAKLNSVGLMQKWHMLASSCCVVK